MTTLKTKVNTGISLQNKVDQNINLYKTKYTANIFLKILPATDSLIQRLVSCQVRGTTCLMITQDVNGKSRGTQVACLVMATDIIFIPTDKQENSEAN